MIRRHVPLKRSMKPIPRTRPLWKGRKPKAKTGGQPEALDSWRKMAKRGHDLWKMVVRCKEPSGVCPMCFKRQWTDAAHIFPKKRYPHIRLEPDNGVPLCRYCHGEYDSNADLHRTFTIQYLGPAKYEALRLRAISRSKTDMSLALMFIKQEFDRLRPMIDALGKGRR